jgi:cyclopropane fatty-acyl-phospholipid synthase-like methyltransferase
MDIIELQRVQHKNFRRHPWERARQRILLFIAQKKFSRKDRLLDVGSGDAFMAKSLAKTYPFAHVTAVDINYTEDIRETIQESGLPNMHFAAGLEEVKPGFDAVVLMDVVEHVPDPGHFLQEVRSVAGEGKETSFFITVPAYQYLFTEHDKVLGHYQRFSRQQLTTLMKVQGFEVLHSGYFFASLFLVRTLQKWKGSRFNEDGLYNWKGGPFITKLVTGILWTEFKISWYLSKLGIHLPGLTCYCLCRPLPL